ncbi:heterogeneous nuclear ribonucleoprotein U-like protein 2 isoform X1 [Pygocentrus nattereri]|uniref:SAP domain-containing protein n=1 Tax=Pygocentrus nattereri TaxID=42514 RepID=A0A3B4C1E7_PYGNA|nr:heterogeneous nuclear ribonucleoprotein U-like protein 2 isoform X1 [Pygocentrus nattereri]
MLVEEVKQLKVAELRAELRGRGLDWRGLKAGLQARLISALAAAQTAGEAALDEASSPEGPCQSATVGTGVTEVVAEGSCEAPREEHQPQPADSGPRSLAYVDQSTQTETEPTANTSLSQPPCSCSKRRKEEEVKLLGSEKLEHFRTNCQLPNETSPETKCGDQEASQQASVSPVEGPPAAAAADGEVSACSSSVSQPDCTSTEDEQSPYRAPATLETRVDGQNEGMNVKRPHEEKGRDYYEFKEEIQYNRAKTPEPGPESEDDMEIDDDDVVRLDLYNSDLHFEVDVDGCSGQPLLWEKFPLLRSGCRLTHGFTQGKTGFEVKLVKTLSAATVDMSFDPEPYVLRVGWSVDSASLQLGEEELSFGFDGAGRAVTAGKAEEFGEPLSEGDVIGCYAVISEGGEAELSFHKNGHSLGVAFHITSSALGGRALYPHILCKNCSVTLNLDPQGTAWYPAPPGYYLLPVLPSAQRTRASLPPPHRKECEVLMMVGMPGSGKSHWAQNHLAKNPEKCYNLLSTNTILHCMKLPGPEHKEVLLQQATQCLAHLIRIAANKRRNFILDQANIYPSARKHKMLRFHGYQRRAVVVVPSDAEWRRRLQQQQQDEGVEAPEMSLLKSKVSFTLPEQGELFEDILFVELCHEEAERLLTTYKEEARRLLPAPPKRKKHQNRHPKFHMNVQGRAHGWSQSSCRRHPYSQSQWRHQKQYGWHPCTYIQPYGCNSDPQRYRDYYQPCTGQWNTCDQSQSYYSNQDNYFGSQVFW